MSFKKFLFEKLNHKKVKPVLEHFSVQFKNECLIFVVFQLIVYFRLETLKLTLYNMQIMRKIIVNTNIVGFNTNFSFTIFLNCFNKLNNSVNPNDCYLKSVRKVKTTLYLDNSLFR